MLFISAASFGDLLHCFSTFVRKMMSDNRLTYRIQIDGLRCFAIISVMIAHWIAWDTINPILNSAPWGNGVILFFVISGFLITNILLEQKQKIDTFKISQQHALKIFYLRRFFRIFPIYFLLLFFLYYIDYPNIRQNFIWFITYTSNILQGITNKDVGNLSHLWSLAVEEQFYIIWPLFIFFIPEKHLLKFFILTLYHF
jgi:peptidoglycan/LPS O-acetylase OafA/YrhL